MVRQAHHDIAEELQRSLLYSSFLVRLFEILLGKSLRGCAQSFTGLSASIPLATKSRLYLRKFKNFRLNGFELENEAIGNIVRRFERLKLSPIFEYYKKGEKRYQFYCDNKSIIKQ